MKGEREAMSKSILQHDAEITKALQGLWESLQAGDGDFCGEVREWHLPRLRHACMVFLKVFPHQSVAAMEHAKTPYDAVEAKKS